MCLRFRGFAKTGTTLSSAVLLEFVAEARLKAIEAFVKMDDGVDVPDDFHARDIFQNVANSILAPRGNVSEIEGYTKPTG